MQSTYYFTQTEITNKNCVGRYERIFVPTETRSRKATITIIIIIVMYYLFTRQEISSRNLLES